MQAIPSLPVVSGWRQPHRAFIAWVRWIAAFLLFRRVRRHLAGFRYLARLTDERPLIVVPNHLSYFDGHLLSFLFWVLYRRRLITVTNVKAFRGVFNRLYHTIAGDLAVDPTDPQGTYASISAALARKSVLVMYPEGHRSEGSGLLPFRHGAFNLAAGQNVPILPVALRDTQHVLPKGSRRYRRGAQASVAFGPLVWPASFAERAAPDARRQAQAMLDHTRKVIETLLAAPESELLSAAAREREARELASLACAELERLLDNRTDTVSLTNAWRIWRLTDLGYLLGVSCAALEVQRLRAIGFIVGALPRALAIFCLPWFRRSIERARRLDANDPYANYVAGQFYLEVPRLLGGNIELAVAAMQRAYSTAESRGLSPNRYAIGYALALARAAQRERAIALLERHFGAAPEAPTGRLARRWQRAQAILAELRSGLRLATN